MGMGDSGRNMAAVGTAVQCLVDRERMSMAQSKVCVSSVGPSPQAFFTLAAMPAALAWYASLSSIGSSIGVELRLSCYGVIISVKWWRKYLRGCGKVCVRGKICFSSVCIDTRYGIMHIFC